MTYFRFHKYNNNLPRKHQWLGFLLLLIGIICLSTHNSGTQPLLQLCPSLLYPLNPWSWYVLNLRPGMFSFLWSTQPGTPFLNEPIYLPMDMVRLMFVIWACNPLKMVMYCDKTTGFILLDVIWFFSTGLCPEIAGIPLIEYGNFFMDTCRKISPWNCWYPIFGQHEFLSWDSFMEIYDGKIETIV
jgi:hypothetical protein